MSFEIPNELLPLAHVSYDFDLDEATAVFGTRDASSGSVLFSTEAIDAPSDASYEAGLPERVLWPTAGTAGDAVELVITREFGSQLLWAPPDAQDIVLPQLPAPFSNMATGAVTSIEVRNHDSTEQDGYGEFLAESAFPVRPNSDVVSRSFPLP